MELVARQMAHYLLSRGSDAHQPFSRKWRSDASAGCRHCSRPARRGGYIFPASGPAESRFIPALEDRVTAEATVHERGTTKVFQNNGPSAGEAGAIIHRMLWGHSHPVVQSQLDPGTFVPEWVAEGPGIF